jgi:hypothetical protein
MPQQANQQRDQRYALIGASRLVHWFINQADMIELFGLTYFQKVTDSVTKGALHIEPGIWIHIPSRDQDNGATQSVAPWLVWGTSRTETPRADKRRQKTGQVLTCRFKMYNLVNRNVFRISLLITRQIIPISQIGLLTNEMQTSIRAVSST